MKKEEVESCFMAALGRRPLPLETDLFLQKDVNWLEERLSHIAKPKCAILLSGNVRKGSILKSLSYLKDVDVFAFVWDNIGVKGTEMNLSLSDPDAVSEVVSRIPHLKAHKMASNKNFIESIRQETESRKYFNFSSDEIFIKSQMYAIKKSHELMEDYCRKTGTSYDMVVKMRFDCSINRFLPDDKTMGFVNTGNAVFVTNDDAHPHPHFSNGCMVCNKMYDIDLHIPHIFNHSNIICDIMAYGGREPMKRWCSMYDHYDEWNDYFAEENKNFLTKRNIPLTITGKNIKVNRIDHMFYLYCSYPERIFQYHMRDYMLISSRGILVRFHR